MKRHLPFFILLFIVACTVNQAEPSPTPEMTVATSTLAASLVPSATASLPATNTIPLPTDIATSQPIVTDTPLPTEPILTPTLEEPTAEPTATPYSGPLPSGHLYFLWDPTFLLPNIGRDEAVHNLYVAMPNDSTNEWDIEVLLTELIGGPQIALSPDMTKFALTKIVDTNGDGFASQEGVNRGFDSYQLYVFDLVTQNLSPLHANISNPYDLNWSGDNQIVTFRDPTGIHLQPVNGSTQKFYDFAPDRIIWAALSPDKQTVAVNLESAQIVLLDTDTGELVFTTNEIGGLSVHKSWSTNSEWLILHQGFVERFFLVNIPQRSITSLDVLQPPGAMSWSPMGATLAFHQYSTAISQIVLINPEDLSITPVLDLPGTESLIHLSWSPDGSSLLVGTKQEQHVTLQMFDLATGSLQELWQGDDLGRFYIVSWSPDGQWILAMLGQSDWPIREEISGLFFISIQNGTAYQLLDTSGTYDPYGFFWLP